MVSIPRFFRKEPPVFDDIGFDIQAVPPEPLPTQDVGKTYALNNSVDPVRKALLARIALVSVADNANLPALLSDEAVKSTIVRQIMLPRNPRIAGDELYELDGMDMIVVVSEEDRRISRDTMRWLKLLKQLGVPMLVLLPFGPVKRHEEQKIAQFAQYVDLPVVTVAADSMEQARQAFLATTMQIAPATGLALAAQMPEFRAYLTQNLMDTAIRDSLKTSGNASAAQMRLVHQICAAYGHNGQQFENNKVALENLVITTRHYTTNLVARLPMKDLLRRTRLTNALSTLLIGYATTIHLGATPPSLRHELLPQIWRLYRASGKPVLE